MSDPIDRAAKAMDENFNPDRHPIMAAMFRDYAQAIDAAGLLVTPAHEAAVAAKALRDAAEAMHDLDAIHMYNGDADLWLDARADRIERERGE